MSQRRMIYSKIFASHDLNTLCVQARYLYIGTIVLADDDGRLSGDARYLRGQIFSYDESITLVDVSKWLSELQIIGIILLYQIGGTSFIQHPNWGIYQYIRKDRRSDSKIPAPTIVYQTTTDLSPNISKDKESKDNTIVFDQFWEIYPKKTDKKNAEHEWSKINSDIRRTIIDDITARSKSNDWRKESGKYVPNPAKYLSDERWKDEIKLQNNHVDRV